MNTDPARLFARIVSNGSIVFPGDGPTQFLVSQEEDNELFVDVPGFGSVCLFVRGEGNDATLHMQVFPFHDADRPLFEHTFGAAAFEQKFGPATEPEPLRCQYSDCAEKHPVADEEESVTCPTCREYLGLPPL